MDTDTVDWGDEYQRHRHDLVRRAYLLLGDVPSAEDAVHAVFERVARSATDVDRPASYLRRAVNNEAISILRRRSMMHRRRRVLEIDESVAPEQVVEFADAMRALTERQRVAVVVRGLDGAADQDICNALGCRPGTARSLVSRGLERLREELER